MNPAHLSATHILARRRRLALPLLLALLAAAGIGWFAHAAGAPGSAGPDRLHRQVGVMEGIIDKVLLDSPNFLVSGRTYTRGVVLPDYGVVFSFNASLTDGSFSVSGFGNLTDLSKLGKLGDLGVRYFNFDSSDDGTVIVRKNEHDSGSDDQEQTQEELERANKARDRADKARDKAKDQLDKLREKQLSYQEMEKERAEKSRELYESGKHELVQTLLDYGETMSELKAGQWIVLAGFFDQNFFLRDSKVSRLVLRARIDDLRAYSTGQITESAARDRVVIEEY